MRLTLLLLSSLLLSSAALLASDKNTEWNGRIEQASAKANIFALPSFEMKADVEVEDSGKSLHGDYTLLWNGADQWKEEISFPGYSETQVGKKGVLSIKRSQDFVPLRIGQLHSTLGYGSGTQPGSFFNQAPRSNERVTKVRRRKVDGRKADCVEIANQANLTREACIDQSSGTFARAEVLQASSFMTLTRCRLVQNYSPAT